jgi:hypothetical protein
MSYEDVVEAQRARAAKEAASGTGRPKVSKQKACAQPSTRKRRPLVDEVAARMQEIAVAGLSKYCAILQFE